MKISAVIGLGYGDEGKGHVVSHLVSKAENPLVVRFNGGHQAGHNVVHEGVQHISASYGSGVLLGAPTFIDKACVISPTHIVNEHAVLGPKLDHNPLLAIHPLCPVTTPWDIKRNQKLEDNREEKHGSVGVGFGETLERESRNYHLLAGDLLFEEVFSYKLDLIIDHYYRTKVDATEFSKFIKDVEKMKKLVHITAQPENIFSYDDVIMEGAQGIMLDQTYGFFPHVTRSNTTTKNIVEGFKEEGGFADLLTKMDVYYATRTYATRHGRGPFTEAQLDLVNNENETNVTNDYQKEFKIGHLNHRIMNYALQCDQIHSEGMNKHIVFNCMDQYELDLMPVLGALNTKFDSVLTSYGPSTSDIKLYKS